MIFLLKPFEPHTSIDQISIDVNLERRPGELSLTYVIKGKWADLKVPPVSSPPQRKDFLWEHTCFECFLGVPESPSYCEWNFSPSGDWAHYEFLDYRKAKAGDTNHEVYEISWMPMSAQEAHLVVTIPILEEGRLDVGLSAVLEMRSGQKSYWALRHAEGKPDFHRREDFLIKI
jgi:hypothetical protein